MDKLRARPLAVRRTICRAIFRTIASILAVALIGVLGACSNNQDASGQQVFPETTTAEPTIVVPEPTYPAKAIIVRDALVTVWANRSFFAYSVKGDSGRLEVIARDGHSTSHTVKKGDTFTADDVRFTVLDVVPNTNTGGGSGGSSAQIVLMPEGSR